MPEHYDALTLGYDMQDMHHDLSAAFLVAMAAMDFLFVITVCDSSLACSWLHIGIAWAGMRCKVPQGWFGHRCSDLEKGKKEYAGGYLHTSHSH
jgi:hypothetical protein